MIGDVNLFIEEEEEEAMYDSTGAVKGSEPSGGIGSNAAAAHSTVIIKQPQIPLNSSTGNDSSDSGNEDFSPTTPPDAPPAYTGTARSIKRSSYAARHDLNGTVVREADLGNGMDTLRPVKRLDAAGSLRASQEYVGSNRSRDAPSPIPIPIPPPTGSERSPTSPNKLRRRSNQASVNARAGKIIVNDVLVPTFQRCIKDDMDAREIEALSMITKGFEDLRDVNPELAYDVVLDLLSSLNESQAVREHVSTTRGLFPHKRITRQSQMTSKGLVVVEQEENISGLPINDAPPARPPSVQSNESSSPKKSPIAELLYMRWLEGLRLKWPSLA